MALASVGAILCLILLLAGASIGLTGSVVGAQPSPSGSPSGPGGPSIAFLNPSVLYEDHVPEVSDKTDTIDTDYHLVVWTAGEIEDPIIEATVQPLVTLPNGDQVPLGNELTVGTLGPVAGSPDTWELFWDIPQSVPDGDAIMTVRLFEQTFLGTEEVASDEVTVQIESDAETVELTWPTQNGPIGWFKPRGGSFRSYLDYQTSDAESFSGVAADFYVTTSDPGSVPEWASCASGSFGGTGVTCTLPGRTTGSQVMALAGEAFDCGVEPLLCADGDPEASDVHRVNPYPVDPHEMTIDIEFRTTDDSPMLGRQRAGEHAPPGPDGATGNERCLAIQAVVRDVLDREVLGANIDWHLTGPNDQVQFGREEPTNQGRGLQTGTTQSGVQPPDKGSHSKEVGRNCDPESLEPEEPRTDGEQGDHNVPVDDDIKHRESINGSALDGGTGVPRGGYFTDIYSPNVGLTEVTAWIDNEPVADDSVNPEADDDLREPEEPSDTLTAQWLRTEATITADPLGGSAVAGTCQKYTLKLRAGTTPVRDLNVDVHAVGPTNDLDFCDPADGSIRKAPDTAAANHEGEDERESSHPGDPPRVQHTEGEADDAGNFVFGILSPEAGDTTITAWIDGTEGNNNDAQGTAPAEPAVTFSHSWASSTGDVEVSFVSPSGFGGDGAAGGDEISNKDDGAPGFHIVTRVDAPAIIEGIEILLAPSGGTTFSNLGEASRVGNSDTYELTWAVDVPDGGYTMRARVLGTNVAEDRTVTVNNATAAPPSPPDQPEQRQAETVKISNPAAAAGVAFTNRAVTVDGTASAGAEGVDLYYTKAPAKDTVAASAWISCGYADLSGSGTSVQSFSGTCALTGSDQPGQVTGIAAIAFDCTQDGGNATPGGTPGRCPGNDDSGDAHRVFGFEATPIVAVEPAETATAPGQCQKMVMTIDDQTGQSIGNVNVDVHARGPGDNVDFCDLDDGSDHQRNAPNDGGHEVQAGQEDQGYHDEAAGPDTSHIEGTNNSAGRFVFGLSSDVTGDTQLTVWYDRDENDAQDGGEASDGALIHWEEGEQPSRCDITGTDGSETLTGTSDSERICAFGGNDVIRARGGNDVVVGGAGNDRMRGNAGNDTVRGGAGRDRVMGGRGGDRLRGGGGNDLLKGHRGFDNLRGHGGRDTLNGGRGRDTCIGGKGRDVERSCEFGARGFAQRTRMI